MTVNDRNARVLAYLRTCIGKATPLNRDIAEHSGLQVSVAEAALYHLRDNGVLVIKGGGNSRSIEIAGEGKTIPRANSRMRARLPPREAQDLVRVDNWTCPRCGARNCTRHSAGVLSTSSRIPAWQAAL